MSTISLQEYIPETINQFEVTRDNTKLLGLAAAQDLPGIEIETDEIRGAGMYGTRSVPATGHVADTEWELKYISYGAHMTQFGDTTQEINLQLRAGMQMQNSRDLTIAYKPFVIFVRGRMIAFNPGGMELGKKTEASVKLNLDMIKPMLGNEPQIYIDKILGIYQVDGKDLLAPIKACLA